MINEKKLLLNLGKQIQAARKAKGSTQERLAELCDFDPTYISLLERGKRNPPFLTLCNVADRLNCSVKKILDID
jgi:transcriptional regulator with XRE-family HTH domain